VALDGVEDFFAELIKEKSSSSSKNEVDLGLIVEGAAPLLDGVEFVEDGVEDKERGSSKRLELVSFDFD